MVPEVRNRLLELSRVADKDIKLAAIYALGECTYTDSEIIARLLELSRVADKDIKIPAVKALGRIHRNS